MTHHMGGHQLKLKMANSIQTTLKPDIKATPIDLHFYRTAYFEFLVVSCLQELIVRLRTGLQLQRTILTRTLIWKTLLWTDDHITGTTLMIDASACMVRPRPIVLYPPGWPGGWARAQRKSVMDTSHEPRGEACSYPPNRACKLETPSSRRLLFGT